jgi:hypothetical protein
MITAAKIKQELFNLNCYKSAYLYYSDKLRLTVDNQAVIKIDFYCNVSLKWSYFHFNEKNTKCALRKFNSLLAIIEKSK